jgi:hypothetical protein
LQIRVERGAARVVEPPRRAVRQQGRRLEVHLHVGDAVGDGLELPDRLPELRAAMKPARPACVTSTLTNSVNASWAATRTIDPS